MRFPKTILLGWLVLLAVAGGVVAAQAERPGNPSKPLTTVSLQPYGPFYLVDVMVNDRGPFKFVIDSGTPSTIVDTSVVDELGLAVEDSPGNATRRVSLGALKLGSARFVDVAAAVHDLDEIWGDGSPSGVLGFDLFGDRLVTLDLPLQKLIVRDGRLPAPDGNEVLGYQVREIDDALGRRLIPTIEITVADRSLNVELNPLGFGTLALPKNRMEQFTLASESGVIGHDRNEDGEFPIIGASLAGSMIVGGYRFDNPSVFFSESFEYPSLGSGILEPFVLTLDLAQQRVRIERPGSRENPLLTKAAGLIPQSGEGDAIKAAFNANADDVRLMVLLSPT